MSLEEVAEAEDLPPAHGGVHADEVIQVHPALWGDTQVSRDLSPAVMETPTHGVMGSPAVWIGGYGGGGIFQDPSGFLM